MRPSVSSSNFQLFVFSPPLLSSQYCWLHFYFSSFQISHFHMIVHGSNSHFQVRHFHPLFFSPAACGQSHTVAGSWSLSSPPLSLLELPRTEAEAKRAQMGRRRGGGENGAPVNEAMTNTNRKTNATEHRREGEDRAPVRRHMDQFQNISYDTKR